MKLNTRLLLNTSLVAFTIMFSGCDDGANGVDGAAGADGTTALIKTTAEAAGDNCADGGTRIDVGFDEDGSGSLSPDEIYSTEYVCNGTTSIDGIDGIDGISGEDGAEGLTALIKTTAEAAGSNCAEGGVRIDAGLDANADGILGSTEITSTNYVCNGVTGVDGVDGDDGRDGTSATLPAECMTVIGYPNENTTGIEGLTPGGSLQSMAFKGNDLYVVSRGDNSENEWPNHLFSVNLATGEGTRIGHVDRATDMAADPLDANLSRLYAMDRTNGDFKEIDVTTADTNVTSLANYEAITFDAEGIGYASNSSGDLYRFDINHTTGEILDDTYLGNMPTRLRSLAYNNHDENLYGASREYPGAVVRIDISMPDAPAGPPPGPSIFESADVNLTYMNKVDCQKDGNCDLMGIDFKNGFMYGVLGDSTRPGSGALVRWNSSCGDYQNFNYRD